MPKPEQWIKSVGDPDRYMCLVRFADISRVHYGWGDEHEVWGTLRSSPEGSGVLLAKFDTEAEALAFLEHLAEQLGAKTLAEIDLTQ